MLIAALAGSLGQAISGYSFGGCLVSTLVGFVGAYMKHDCQPVWFTGAVDDLNSR
jgi:uncharacterized membrane protein YeaQ/YmgE (transglycosylase-associated protein family)